MMLDHAICSGSLLQNQIKPEDVRHKQSTAKRGTILGLMVSLAGNQMEGK
jgi:hypothetical protein